MHDQPEIQRVFVHRSLELEQMDVVGFDLDETLIRYHRTTFRELTMELTISRLVEKGYPKEISELSYSASWGAKSLIVDLRHGNVLEDTRAGPVARACHGKRWLKEEELKKLYDGARFDGALAYFRIQTEFAAPLVPIFTALVDFMDAQSSSVAYHHLFRDVLQALNAALFEGSPMVRKEPTRFLEPPDESLVPTFEMFRRANKRLFLLTNSGWEHADAILGWLLGGRECRWSDFFEFVVVDASKPNFFKGKEAFQEIKASTGGKGTRFLRAGNAAQLQEWFGVEGARVLFMGDHIYDDIISARQTVGWRTAMIEGDIEAPTSAQRSELPERLGSLEPLGWEGFSGTRVLASGMGRKFEENACLVTSRISNFLEYSPTQHFKP